MTIAERKQQREQEIFRQFIRLMHTEHEWVSISSRPEPEPDLLCHHNIDGDIAFELVSIVDEKIAELLSAGIGSEDKYFRTSDPTYRILRKKLSKSENYQFPTASHIELLAYTTGQIVTPDDVIIEEINALIENSNHNFKKIWFMGEATIKLLHPV